ncbi:MAG: ABC-2 family transporter protein [Deltaproteobacteria bacterium]|nr:ABC-2 family transporter protein [Deltaproteobacteria bacterium]
MLRYATLLYVQIRASLLLALQYRWDFVIDGAISVLWAVTALVPLTVAFGERASIAGWTFGEALLVLGWFTLLQGILEGAINPSLVGVVEHIRRGTLDFVLIKPADSQFLVSTARFLPWRATNAVTAAAVFVYAFRRIGHGPSIQGVAAALVLFATAVLLLYSLWILTVSAAFYVVKVDNLTYLFGAVFDAARWPSSIFKGALRLVFTFVIPLALMTTFPAQALLDRLSLPTLAGAIAGALLFAGAARFVWLQSIRKYTSASS